MITSMTTLSSPGPGLATGAATRGLAHAPGHAGVESKSKQPAPVPEGRRPGVPPQPGQKEHVTLPREDAVIVHIKDHADLPREDLLRPDAPATDVPLAWGGPVPILAPRGPAAAASQGGRQREPLAALDAGSAGGPAAVPEGTPLTAEARAAHGSGGAQRHARRDEDKLVAAERRAAPPSDGAAPRGDGTPLVTLPAQRVAEPTPAPPSSIETLPVTPAPAQGVPSALAPISGAVEAAEAHVSAAPGSPAFAAQVGARISTFVREGVEFATIHLHPSDMGPVHVQIQLEGHSAQVQLAAEHALTRQALEQALPALAGQLREGGFTLAGGGVFEQAPQQAREQAQAGTAAQGRSAEPAPAPMPIEALAWRTRGLVDLVA